MVLTAAVVFAGNANGQVIINEFLASNVSVNPDMVDFDDYSDWIELYNDGDDPVDLGGYFLTDNLAMPLKWAVPAGAIIEPKGYMLFWADDYDDIPGNIHQRPHWRWNDFTTQGYHTNFKVSSEGEELGLYETEGRQDTLLIRQGSGLFKTEGRQDNRLVARGSVWKYFDKGSDQGALWTGPSFDDSQWASGRSKLGYGDGGETTRVGFGPSEDDKHITTYFRRTFNVSDAGRYKALTIRLLRDDGAVVYLNGVEIVRSNMPDGPIDHETLADSSVEEDTFHQWTINAGDLVDGENVLAVEIHQVSPTSSDISFDLELTWATSAWKYLDDGSNQGTAWTDPLFDDSQWASGLPQLGYGPAPDYAEGDEATVVDGGPDGDRYITTFFRKTFDVDNAGDYQRLTIDLLRDDGAVVYLNGVEIIRSNMPDGPISHETLASSSAEEGTFHRWTIGSGDLVNGENVLAVEIHQVSPDSSDISFDLELTLGEGPVWKYLDDGSNQGRAWADPLFDDSQWKSGPSQLGYGDGDEATRVGRGLWADRNITTYFRQTFDVNNALDYQKLTIGLLRDDGAVVYLNGAEIIRSNMPDGPIDHETLASSTIGGNEEDTFYQWTIDSGDLVDGENVLAAEIHQAAPASSDISFDLELTATGFTGLALVDTAQFGPQIPDVSRGRNPAHNYEWYNYGEPTPGTENNTEPTVSTEKTGLVEFSMVGGFYTGAQTLALSPPSPSALIRYTLDASKPNHNSPEYDAPIPITQNTVIKARAFEPDKLPGEISTNTYFINESDFVLPVVSIVADPPTLWGEKIGIYQNEHKQREIPVSLEYFEANGDRGFKVNAGARLGGMNIWRFAQKPLAIYMRGRYGPNAINYQLFEGKAIGVFERIVFRNGGDDWDEAMLRDAMTESLLEGRMSNGIQAYSPSVVFLNGEYWGLHNIRERFDPQYFASNYGVDPDNIDHLEYKWTGPSTIGPSVAEGDMAHYLSMMDFVEQNTLADDENYNHVKTLMDTDSFIDYLIIEMYVHNVSWRHNREWWSPRTTGAKWKWLIPDLDRGFYIDNVSESLLDDFRDEYALFGSLLENEDFRNRFIQRFAAHLNSTFHAERIANIVDSLSDRIAPEMARHVGRWSGEGGVPSVEDWHTYLQEIRDFGEQRGGFVFEDITNELNLAGTVQLTVNVDQPGNGRIFISDVPMPEDINAGSYFLYIPVGLRAVPNPGFEFVEWEGISATSPIVVTSNLDSLVLILIQNTELTAIFRPSDGLALLEDVSADRTLVKEESPYYADSNVTVDPGVTLTVEEGVEIRMPASGNLLIHGSIIINGTNDNPVMIVPNYQAGASNWGALSFVDPTGPSIISWAVIKGATKGEDPILQKAAISGYYADLTIEYVRLEDVEFPIFTQYGSTVVRNATISTDATCDYINIKHGYALVEDSVFLGNSAPDTDAIDFDGITDGIIRNNRICNFDGINGDGIDIGENSQNVRIHGNLIYNSHDKGISIGQESSVIIERNLIVGCDMGVAVKDSSYAYVNQNTFYNNDISVAGYEKNAGKGGGNADVVNTIMSGSGESPIFIDDLSALNISYSLSDTDILPGEENLLGDPLFIDPLVYNLELHPDSPGIDRGDPAHPLDPDESITDMGGYYTYDPADYPCGFSSSGIVISEIMYRPAPSLDSEDWIELYNPTDHPIDLSGWKLKDDNDAHVFTIPARTTLDSFSHLVICEDPLAFSQAYPSVQHYIGGFDFGFGTNDQVRLFHSTDSSGSTVSYSNVSPWPTEPDGYGPSLELLSPYVDNSLPENWLASGADGGTPGKHSDIDGNGVIDLSDAVLALKIADSYIHQPGVYRFNDVNIDGRTGIEEVIYVLQVVAGVRLETDPEQIDDQAPIKRVSGIRTNGEVRALLMNGPMLYAGGSFTKAWSTGANDWVDRRGLVAYNISDGDVTDLIADTDSRTVQALAIDGATLFLGGSFHEINGQPRERVASLDLSTGELNPWSPNIGGGRVYALALGAESILYIGGAFTSVNGVERNRIAAVNMDGNVTPFNPNGDGTVLALEMNPTDSGIVFVAGEFTNICGSIDGRYRYLAAAEVGPDGMCGPGFTTPVSNPVFALDTSNTHLFAGVGGAANRVVSFDAGTYARQWSGFRAEGDVQAVSFYNDCVYFGFHDGLYLSPDPYKLARLHASDGTLDEEWPMPELTGFMGVWAISVNTSSGFLATGGVFTEVNGYPHEGLAVFLDFMP